MLDDLPVNARARIVADSGSAPDEDGESLARPLADCEGVRAQIEAMPGRGLSFSEAPPLMVVHRGPRCRPPSVTSWTSAHLPL